MIQLLIPLLPIFTLAIRKEMTNYDYLDHGADWKTYDYCMTGTQQSPIELSDFPLKKKYDGTHYFITNYVPTLANLTFYNTSIVADAYDTVNGFGSLFTIAPDDNNIAMYFSATTLRIRAPSEHTVKGKRYAMEIQITHKVLHEI